MLFATVSAPALAKCKKNLTNFAGCEPNRSRDDGMAGGGQRLTGNVSGSRGLGQFPTLRPRFGSRRCGSGLMKSPASIDDAVMPFSLKGRAPPNRRSLCWSSA
jgi:hypothetical protein